MYQTVALILTLGLIVLLALGIPIGYSLGALGAIGYLVYNKDIGTWVTQIAPSLSMKMTGSLANFVLLSIPLFILAAKIMNGSSITKRIFDFCNVAVGCCTAAWDTPIFWLPLFSPACPVQRFRTRQDLARSKSKL